MTLAGRVSGHCDQVWLKSVKLWLSYKHECGCQKKEEELEKIVFTSKHVHLASPFDIGFSPLTPLGLCHM